MGAWGAGAALGSAGYEWLWPWAGALSAALAVLGLARARSAAGALLLLAAASTAGWFWWAHALGAHRPGWHGLWFAASFVATGLALALALHRTADWGERLRRRLQRLAAARGDSRTDIRTVAAQLPDALGVYDPLPHCTRPDAIFAGLDANRQPVYLEQELWRRSHVDIAGMTGSGKGVLAGVLLAQAAQQGEAVCMVDPKRDEYAPRVLERAARDAGVAFHALDLTTPDPGWNPLAHATADEMTQLFVSCFGLAERGSDADYYRLQDRAAARTCAQLAADNRFNLAQLLAEFRSMPQARKAPMFLAALEEAAGMESADAGGLDLGAALDAGGVVYVRGAVRHPRVARLQRMLVLSAIQHCERREPGTGRHVCLFLDELRYLISPPVLEALASIRDKHAHLLLAHQTLQDLHHVTADLDPRQAAASVAENCGLKFSYRVRDPDTAQWLARMSGTIRADDESRTLETDALGRARSRSQLGLRQTERHWVDANMLLSLPAGCAVLFSDQPARLVFTAPVPVEPAPNA